MMLNTGEQYWPPGPDILNTVTQGQPTPTPIVIERVMPSIMAPSTEAPVEPVICAFRRWVDANKLLAGGIVVGLGLALGGAK